MGFDEIDRLTFYKKIWKTHATELDIENQAQQQKSQRIEARANQLVNSTAIQACADKMIDEQAKMRVTENAIQGAVAQQLQEKIKQQETALGESRNGAMWGWILFDISVVLLIAVAANN